MAERAETGTMRFGCDWAGCFIRGDNAFNFASHLSEMIEAFEEDKDIEPIVINECQGLLNLLRSSQESEVSKKPDSIQKLKPFDECVKE